MLLINLALASLLIYISIDDILNFRIKNEAILILIFLTILKLFILGYSQELVTHLLYATLIFLAILLIYCLGIFGGGDAKLLGVIFFIIEKKLWLNFYLDLMVITLFYSLCAYLNLIPSRKSENGHKMPYGPCICAACMLNLF